MKYSLVAARCSLSNMTKNPWASISSLQGKIHFLATLVFHCSHCLCLSTSSFENGKIFGYSAPLPGQLHYAESGNSSCPNWPDPQTPGTGNPQKERCRKIYDTTTSPVTGKATGPPDRVQWYDPRKRSWYQPTIEAGGAQWSPIYIFAEEGSPVGITAAKEIRTETNDLLGVFGE